VYDNHYKIKAYFERTIELIDTHHPDEIAIEATLLKNVQSMLKLGRASSYGCRIVSRYSNYGVLKLKWQLPETKMPVKNKLPKCCKQY
jgi:Holliday junction resolvasome RuvABC endonuclease subunit